MAEGRKPGGRVKVRAEHSPPRTRADAARVTRVVLHSETVNERGWRLTVDEARALASSLTGAVARAEAAARSEPTDTTRPTP